MSKKSRRQKARGHGMKSVYAEYRYGPKQPIALACPEHYRGEKRERVVSGLCQLFGAFQSTPFESEGATRAGIRSHLCLEGLGWAPSDEEAHRLIREAFSRIGAKRPTWEQGQPEYIVPRENCGWCWGPLDIGKSSARYCCSQCARMAVTNRECAGMKSEDAHRIAALRLVRSERQEARTCEQCKRLFHPRDPSDATRFCSKGCFHAHRHTEAAETVERDCAWCGTAFKGKNSMSLFCKSGCQSAMFRMKSGAMPKRLTPPVFDYLFKQAA